MIIMFITSNLEWIRSGVLLILLFLRLGFKVPLIHLLRPPIPPQKHHHFHPSFVFQVTHLIVLIYAMFDRIRKNGYLAIIAKYNTLREMVTTV